MQTDKYTRVILTLIASGLFFKGSFGGDTRRVVFECPKDYSCGGLSSPRRPIAQFNAVISF